MDRETLLMKGWSSSFQINFLLEAPPSPRPSLFSHLESPFGILELSTMGTPNDQAVLQAIFNPDAPFGDTVGLDLGDGEEAEKEEREEDQVFPQAQLEQSKALELQGVIAAEAGDLSTALERFGQAICLLPERASAYNNRAQARRLLGDVAGALEDLERAVELSGGRGRAARQSFVQRGLLARLQGRDDDARRDFERAARLGSPFARRQLVLLNPYAALCNRMLADMMEQLRRPRDSR
ncbi:tetratricopeptide repeat protein 36 [Hylobates moloch]|uniref:tetratricopeptide repeat protein 36 n=1 Tax=Hylobates moloch TaxID=81572 RepID=UPI0026774133|nr:tetratricopeptide repeat protein 36 [Hylobates moloch]